jgi:Glyoxalase-like domain
VSTNARIDHLVVAADTLEQGVAWCETTLGITPGPGGKHALMGTHNRLFSISSRRFPQAYFEIMAIDPGATDPGRHRWFDLDDAALREAVRHEPRLIHFVARTSEAQATVKALEKLGLDRGPLLNAQRETPAGPLRWRISVREDGQRLFYGTLPTLIEWGEVHPVDAMPNSGVSLQSLHAAHPRADALRAAYAAIGMQDVTVGEGPPELVAMLRTPRGDVMLASKGA